MRWLRRVIRGATALARSEQAERELDEELRAYLEAAVKEKMRRGLGRDQATRVTSLELGLVSVESVKERVRDVGWETRLESIWQDAGVIAGCAAALGPGRLAQSMLFGIEGPALLVMAAATIGVTAIALSAAAIPARRAVRVDPAVTLRAE